MGNTMKILYAIRTISFALFFSSILFSNSISAEDYKIDTAGMHAAIQFKIKHLGYSWLVGRFDKFDGTFSYDKENPSNSKIEMTVKTASINSNHAERDKHLRGKNFLEVNKFPEAKFVSSSYTKTGKSTAILKGELTLHGVTHPISMTIKQIGSGRDPWGGYRRGFEGTLKITLADYGLTYGLGYQSRELWLNIYLEGLRQKK